MQKLIYILLLITVNTYGISIFELTGANGNNTSFNGKIFASGSYSTYFNPSLLIKSKTETDVALFSIYQNFNIDLKKRNSNNDITDDIYDSRVLNEDGSTSPVMFKPLPTYKLNKRGNYNPEDFNYYFSFGFVKELLKDKFTIGFIALMPLKSFQSQATFFPDEREQYFSNSLHYELYEDRIKNTNLAIGAAYKVKDFVFGIGGTLSIFSYTKTKIYISDVSVQKIENLSPSIDVKTKFVPHFSLLYAFNDFTVTSTVHLPYYSDIDVETETIFYNYVDENNQFKQSTKSKLRFGYEPLKISLGLSYVIDKFTIGTVFNYTKWSDYVNRLNEKGNFEDTVYSSLGILYKNNSKTISFDINFIPSPVPNQTKTTNYVDNSKVGFAINYKYSFKTFDIGIFSQFYYFIKEDVEKTFVTDEFPKSVDVKSGEVIESSLGLQTNNPGYPGYSNYGFILNFGILFSFNI